MTAIRVGAERTIDAPAAVVYRCIADYREHHPRFLPPAFSNWTVETGGVGAGTVVRFGVTAGGRTTVYRARVDEPEPGRVLVELDDRSGTTTTFTVDPAGDRSHVTIATAFPARPGPAGWLVRLLAPHLLGPVYRDELERLDQYARQVARDA